MIVMEDAMYALFCGDVHYPVGGMGDFKGIFQTVEEAQEAYFAGDQWHEDYTHQWEWAHIVNTQTWETVKKFIFEKET